MPENMHQFTESELFHTVGNGNPYSDYYGFPDVQEALYRYDRDERDEQEAAFRATESAAERIKAIMEPTPLEAAPRLSEELGVPTFVKREDLTPVRSFKVRGAYNKLAQLPESERAAGIIAASAGNHAQGVALSAQLLGLDATIVMPRTTPEAKQQAVHGFGANVILHGDNYSEAYEWSQQLLAEQGGTFVHPFDDLEVIAGQGTVGKEIIEQNPSVTHIVVPIGGGGLLAGIAQYVKTVRPDITVIGVQAEDSNAMQASIAAGFPIRLPHVGIFADGVAVKQVGELTFDIVNRFADDIITVTNDQVAAAMTTFMNETRSLIEPAGALSIAGAKLLAERGELADNAVVATIASGAGVDMAKIGYAIERSEIGRNREAIFAITLPEQPGALLQLCRDAINGHNITSFHYRRNDREQAHILVGFNVKGQEDKASFMQQLDVTGYEFYDFTGDEVVREHLVHMIGGGGARVANETLYTIEFPEKPGALMELLESLGERWNISLFHYRGALGDTGRVLIGFEDHDQQDLEGILDKVTQSWGQVHTKAASLFL